MRYLGNTRSREFHDLHARRAQCQIEEIAEAGHDRAFTPDTAGQALAEGYDPCAWCVGARLRPALYEELLIARARAEQAEARLVTVTLDRDALRRQVADAGAALARARALAASQQAQIAALTERLRAAEVAARQVTLDAMVRSLAAAIEAGDDALTDRAVVSARAEVKAALQVSGAGAGLVLGVPGTFDPGALSTVGFELRRIAPDSATQDRRTALADILGAVHALQRALDDDADADADASAAAAAFAAEPPPDLASAAAALRSLVGALERLAARRNALAAAVTELREAVEALHERDDAPAGRAVATALGRVSAEVARR